MAAQDFGMTLALQGLAWLAADEDRILPFLAQSGLLASELRSRAGEPEVLAAVLDFLLSDEAMLLSFCGDLGLNPAEIAPARAQLPGGDVPHWT
ncbi:DUF3572 domain-containing protein [Pseudogemmobacter faecipullorum]|uniref:DUF3572 domain-containing protein n=1 Tax=Pseudogemmobacter faecipullorum TaxID=2755041 RepID=A0ABS8CL10_9RHOB|nr:DUF3572 domain-containing protein [Pseudogemmobacter faecipullorum]MCB5409860.1 DUF3572 domain-containing protein [Pseudogemmobacter faecipullorum]